MVVDRLYAGMLDKLRNDVFDDELKSCRYIYRAKGLGRWGKKHRMRRHLDTMQRANSNDLSEGRNHIAEAQQIPLPDTCVC